jgi:hypothetical protein
MRDMRAPALACEGRTDMRRAGIIAGLVLALLLGMAASSSAGKLSVSTENITATWRSMTFSSGASRIRCPVTLEGRFVTRSIAKQNSTSIGSIERATTSFVSCVERTFVTTIQFLRTFPWAFFYTAFEGTLPNINTIRLELIEFAVLLTISGVSCLYQATLRSAQRGSLRRNFTTGEITSFPFDATPAIPQNGMVFGCPTNINVEGSGEVTRTGGTQRLTVELI